MEEKRYLTREDIINSDSGMEIEEVPVPEFGGIVRVKTLTARERDEWENLAYIKLKDMRNMRASLVSKTAVDEKGKLLFTEEDVIVIGNKSAKAIDRIFTVAQKLNGLGPQNVEELTKNLLIGQSEDSISD
ncbi:MAG: hypothetical protein KKF27_21150 [Gammaproteobacteria bacterium]|nr:hypothetical protein [Gammaproteobacteria bacterium]